jgi:hypothetical protein
MAGSTLKLSKRKQSLLTVKCLNVRNLKKRIRIAALYSHEDTRTAIDKCVHHCEIGLFHLLATT